MARGAGRFEARPMTVANLSPLIGVLLAVFSVVTATSVGLDDPVNLHFEPCALGGANGAPQRLYVSFLANGEVQLGASRAVSDHEALAGAIR